MWPWDDWFGAETPEAGATFWIGFFAALIAVWGVISQRAIARRTATMELLTSLEADKDLISARETYIRLTERPGTLVSLADDLPIEKRAKADETLLKNIASFRLVFNYYELLAIGIQAGILDYHIYKRYSRSAALKDWERAAPLIFALRQKYGQPSMYHEFEELARWLRGTGMPRRRRFLSLWR